MKGDDNIKKMREMIRVTRQRSDISFKKLGKCGVDWIYVAKFEAGLASFREEAVYDVLKYLQFSEQQRVEVCEVFNSLSKCKKLRPEDLSLSTREVSSMQQLTNKYFTLLRRKFL